MKQLQRRLNKYKKRVQRMKKEKNRMENTPRKAIDEL